MNFILYLIDKINGLSDQNIYQFDQILICVWINSDYQLFIFVIFCCVILSLPSVKDYVANSHMSNSSHFSKLSLIARSKFYLIIFCNLVTYYEVYLRRFEYLDRIKQSDEMIFSTTSF